MMLTWPQQLSKEHDHSRSLDEEQEQDSSESVAPSEAECVSSNLSFQLPVSSSSLASFCQDLGMARSDRKRGVSISDVQEIGPKVVLRATSVGRSDSPLKTAQQSRSRVSDGTKRGADYLWRALATPGSKEWIDSGTGDVYRRDPNDGRGNCMVKALLPGGDSRRLRWDLAARLEDDLQADMPTSIFTRLASSLELGRGVMVPQGDRCDLERQIARLRATDGDLGAEWLEIGDLAAFTVHHKIRRVTVLTDGKPGHKSVVEVYNGPRVAPDVVLLFSLALGHYERLELTQQGGLHESGTSTRPKGNDNTSTHPLRTGQTTSEGVQSPAPSQRQAIGAQDTPQIDLEDRRSSASSTEGPSGEQEGQTPNRVTHATPQPNSTSGYMASPATILSHGSRVEDSSQTSPGLRTRGTQPRTPSTDTAEPESDYGFEVRGGHKWEDPSDRA